MDIYYRMGGGCGSTTVKGQLKNNNFDLNYRSNWMGMKEPIIYNISGSYDEHKDNIYRLTVTNMKVNGEDFTEYVYGEHPKIPIYFDLYLFPYYLDFQFGDIEHECICMANGASVNDNYKYNALLLCISQEYPNNDDLKKIKDALKCLKYFKCNIKKEQHLE